MKPLGALAVLGLACLSTPSRARADPLDVKLGLWESTLTSNVKGSLLSDAQLKKLTPAQRESLKAQERKQQAAGPETTTSRTCLTREDLARGFDKGEDDEKDCKRTTVVATRTAQEITVECAGENQSRREWRIQATSREGVKGKVKLVSANGAVTMDFTARWIAAECGDDD